MALNVYADEHQGYYPRVMIATSMTYCFFDRPGQHSGDLRPLLEPYGHDANLFYCPSGGRLNPEEWYMA